MESQIITIGGGGFLTNSEAGLDPYILEQASTSSPSIGFIGTASGDDTKFHERFLSRFSELDCQPSILNLFGRVQNLKEWISQQDVIYVGGGNTKSMLGVWSAWGIPDLLRSALRNGTIISGVSAGAICWFESGITDSVDTSYTALKGLGMIKGSCCPHYSLEPDRKPVFERLILSNDIPEGIAIDDGAAVHWVNGKPSKIIVGKEGASAYFVSSSEGKLTSRQVPSCETVDVVTKGI
jgi:dipeptidase E